MSRITALAALLLVSSVAVADGAEPVCADGSEPVEWYLDGDEDGFGDRDVWVLACEAPEGFVDNGADKNDDNPDILDF